MCLCACLCVCMRACAMKELVRLAAAFSGSLNTARIKLDSNLTGLTSYEQREEGARRLGSSLTEA